MRNRATQGCGDSIRHTARQLASARKPLRAIWLLAVAAIIAGSLLPSESAAMQAIDRVPLSDKVEHAAAYAFLAFVPAIHERRRRVIAAAAGAVLLGVALEFAQLWSGWRDFEVADMVADGIGVAVGLGIGWTLRNWAVAQRGAAMARSGTGERIPKAPPRHPAARA
jgi:VanZ family protein